MQKKKLQDDRSLFHKPDLMVNQIRRTSRRKIKKTHRKRAETLLILFILILGMYGFYLIPDRKEAARDGDNQISNGVAQAYKPSGLLSGKHEIRKLLSGRPFADLAKKYLHADVNGQTYVLETSINMPLQTYIGKILDTATSLYIGIVVMQPDSGRVLSMVSFDKKNPGHNPCVDSIFPAASLFKIVTAAAAIEQANLLAESKLKYNGRKHTLYKSQLIEKNNRYTHHITLRESFAHSINPVFGKLGMLYLGKTILEDYAAAFGFNREIPFEIPISPSRITVLDKPYNWAEIASGFNQETTISPIHGALVGSVVLNRGRMMEPSLIDFMYDDSGRTIYTNQLAVLTQAISPDASNIIGNLMTATVTLGTARKAFRGYRQNRILSKLNIGGKTGSINNDPKFDWFVGFAHEKEGEEKIVVSAVVAHEKFIGRRASTYGRMIMEKHFKGHFAEMKQRVAQAD